MPKPQLWSKVKSDPNKFARNANAPRHATARKSPSGDGSGMMGVKKSDLKK